jgi:hypothetical protein
MADRFRKDIAAAAMLLSFGLAASAQEPSLTPHVPDSHPVLAIGSGAPDFALPGIDGAIHRLSDYQRVVLANLENETYVGHPAYWASR